MGIEHGFDGWDGGSQVDNDYGFIGTLARLVPFIRKVSSQ